MHRRLSFPGLRLRCPVFGHWLGSTRQPPPPPMSLYPLAGLDLVELAREIAAARQRMLERWGSEGPSMEQMRFQQLYDQILRQTLFHRNLMQQIAAAPRAVVTPWGAEVVGYGLDGVPIAQPPPLDRWMGYGVDGVPMAQQPPSGQTQTTRGDPGWPFLVPRGMFSDIHREHTDMFPPSSSDSGGGGEATTVTLTPTTSPSTTVREFPTTAPSTPRATVNGNDASEPTEWERTEFSASAPGPPGLPDPSFPPREAARRDVSQAASAGRLAAWTLFCESGRHRSPSVTYWASHGGPPRQPAPGSRLAVPQPPRKGEGKGNDNDCRCRGPSALTALAEEDDDGWL